MLRLFNRPVGVVAIAFPWLVVSLGLFTLCIFILVEAIREPIPRMPLDMGWELAVTWLVVLEGLLLGLGLGAFTMAIGLWKLEERARFAARMMAAIWALLFIVPLVLGVTEPPPSEETLMIVLSTSGSGLAFNLWSFWYLSRRRVKDAFAPVIVSLNLEGSSPSSLTR